MTNDSNDPCIIVIPVIPNGEYPAPTGGQGTHQHHWSTMSGRPTPLSTNGRSIGCTTTSCTKPAP